MDRSGVIGCLLIFLTTTLVGPSFADKVYPVPWHIPYRDEFVAHKTYIGEDRIPAILLQRRELVGKRKPAAIVLHGATSQKEHTLGFAPSIARWGTLVVAVDAYGHGERKDEELQSKLQGPERGRMLRRVVETTAREIPAVVDYLIERDDVDGERIACVGGSMGGFITSLVATSEHRIKAFVMMGAGAMFDNSIGDDGKDDSMGGGTFPDPDRNFIEKAELVAPTPILLMHLSNDPAVSPERSRRFFRVLKPFYEDNPDDLVLKIVEGPEVGDSEDVPADIRLAAHGISGTPWEVCGQWIYRKLTASGQP